MKRNIIRSFVGMQINLESVIQSEMSQNEKSKYCIVMHTHTHIYIYIWNLEKMVQMNLFAGQE